MIMTNHPSNGRVRSHVTNLNFGAPNHNSGTGTTETTVVKFCTPVRRIN